MESKPLTQKTSKGNTGTLDVLKAKSKKISPIAPTNVKKTSEEKSGDNQVNDDMGSSGLEEHEAKASKKGSRLIAFTYFPGLSRPKPTLEDINEEAPELLKYGIYKRTKDGCFFNTDKKPIMNMARFNADILEYEKDLSDKPDKPPFTTNMAWLFYGKELCPKTGRVHYQSICYLHNQITISAFAKKMWHSHCEYARFAPTVNRDYCRKGSQEKDEWRLHNINGINFGKDSECAEFGKMPAQGERVDLKSITDKILNGEITPNDVYKTDPMMYHQYGRTLEKGLEIRNLMLIRTWLTTCDWLWGPTGVGKSHEAYQKLIDNFKITGIKNFYTWTDDNGFWNGYQGQEIVIINEFRGEIPFQQLLQLIDKWPIDVKVKCKSSVPFLAKHIIITSPLEPKDIYGGGDSKDNLNQLMERITVIHLNGKSKRGKEA
jgi:hypothetical protein|nr:MAG: replication associated protein [Cressdnaviricota sp.]